MLLDHASGTNEEADEDLRTALEQINGNTQLSEHYLQLARDLDVMEVLPTSRFHNEGIKTWWRKYCSPLDQIAATLRPDRSRFAAKNLRK